MDSKGGRSPYLLVLLVFVLGIGLGYLLRMYYPGVVSEGGEEARGLVPTRVMEKAVVTKGVEGEKKVKAPEEKEKLMVPEASPSAGVSGVVGLTGVPWEEPEVSLSPAGGN